MQEFEAAGGKLPPGLWEEILEGLKEVEADYGAKFADPADPLLVSVRSGAAISMPGKWSAPVALPALRLLLACLLLPCAPALHVIASCLAGICKLLALAHY